MKSFPTKIALAIVILSITTTCYGRGTQTKDGGTPQQKLTAERIDDGVVPEAMQWKRTPVFAVASSAKMEFYEWLLAIPSREDKFKTISWKVPPPMPTELFVLFGWTGGSDDARRAKLDSALVIGNQVEVYLSQPLVTNKGQRAFPCDETFIGWKIPLSDLIPGEYTGRLLVRQDTIRTVYEPEFGEVFIPGRGYRTAGEEGFVILPDSRQ